MEDDIVIECKNIIPMRMQFFRVYVGGLCVYIVI